MPCTEDMVILSEKDKQECCGTVGNARATI